MTQKSYFIPSTLHDQFHNFSVCATLSSVQQPSYLFLRFINVLGGLKTFNNWFVCHTFSVVYESANLASASSGRQRKDAALHTESEGQEAHKSFTQLKVAYHGIVKHLYLEIQYLLCLIKWSNAPRSLTRLKMCSHGSKSVSVCHGILELCAEQNSNLHLVKMIMCQCFAGIMFTVSAAKLIEVAC